MMIYVYLEDEPFKKQIEYVFMTVFYVLGFQYETFCSTDKIRPEDSDILLGYVMDLQKSQTIFSKVFKNIILIKNSRCLFGESYLTAESMPVMVRKVSLPLQGTGIKDIVSIYSIDDQLYIQEKSDGSCIITNIDFISDAFFMLSRYEEFVNSRAIMNEPYKRFPAYESVAYKYGFLDRPVVNEFTELLWSFINSFKLGFKRRSLWKGKDFALFLSHDVDRIQKYGLFSDVARNGAGLLIKHGKVKQSFKYMWGYMKGLIKRRDPYWTFEYIMDNETDHGFRSSFYFRDFRQYNICAERIKSLIEKIEDKGFEVGYHGGFDSFDDYKIMKEEIAIIDKSIQKKPYGCRQHYLRFKTPCTWRYQHNNGLLYDTTLSFSDVYGFRCGICLPYKPYDLSEDKIIDIWEIPLIIMDDTLYSYLNLNGEEALKRIIEMAEVIKKYGGVFSFLYHNTSFTDFDKPGWKDIFVKMLDQLKLMNCEGLNGRQIVEIWQGGTLIDPHL